MSQLINCAGWSPNHVSERASGEKTSHRVSPDGGSRMLSRPRVTGSRISIVALGLPQTIAMNLLHGDHTATSIAEGNFIAAMLGSHEFGSPCTILAKGRACCSYIARTIEVLGDRGRAEW